MSEILYYPILKWKSGEKKALKSLSSKVKSSITPIIEIVDDEDIEDIITTVKSFSDISTIYFDTSYVEQGGSGYLEEIIREAIGEEISFLPVLTYEEFNRRSIGFSEICNEILVKIPIPSDFEGDSYKIIFDTLSTWQSQYNININILLDLGSLEDRENANRQYSELTKVIDNYILGADFLKVIIGATSFPNDISNLSSGNELFCYRFDIKIYKQIINSPNYHNISNRLAYADYGVTKFTESEIDFSMLRNGILPKARYTTEDSYWIIKGKKDNRTKEWIVSHQTIAQKIVDSEYYYGQDFSFGDYDIKERALGHKIDNPDIAVGPGNNTNWVTIAVSHHVSVVTDELSKFHDSSVFV